MPEETNVPFVWPPEPRQILVLQDHFPVQGDPDVVSFHQDFLFVPFTDWFEESPLSRHKFVEGAMELGVFQFFVAVCGIVEDLAFVAFAMWVRICKSRVETSPMANFRSMAARAGSKNSFKPLMSSSRS